MKLKLTLLALAATLNINAATILVSDFGTSFDTDYAAGFGDFVGITSTGATGTTTFGATATNGQSLTALLPSPLDITGYTTVSVAASVNAGNNSNSNFTIVLYSGVSDFASADFLASDFGASITTVTKTLLISGAFDPAAVIYYGINGGVPSGTDAFRYTFDSLSVNSPVVVPEPSTYASLAGVAVLGFVAYRRRRVAA